MFLIFTHILDKIIKIKIKSNFKFWTQKIYYLLSFLKMYGFFGVILIVLNIIYIFVRPHLIYLKTIFLLFVFLQFLLFFTVALNELRIL